MSGRSKDELRAPRRDLLRHAPRTLGVALDLALIAALAAATAYFTWVWLAPRAKAAPPPVAQSAALDSPSAAARRVFADAPQAASATAVRLVGVVAPGRAVFIAENGRPRTAAVGESVGDLVVREVNPDHVVVSRGGSLERLRLERRAALPPSPGARGDAGR